MTCPLVFPTISITTAVAAFLLVPFATPPIGWLPEAGGNETFLGTLLTGQAAIAALTLAVTLFVMQGVSNKPDADDRMYREYFRRSRVRTIFWGSLIAVLATGVILMMDLFVGETDAGPGIRNLLILAAAAFLANLLFAGTLFERAMHLAQPAQWRAMKRAVNERDVREAIQAFLIRHQRGMASLAANEPDITAAFPDPGEGSANEAIKAFLDDARRAMAERRQGEFAKSITSIEDLITYAMDEIEKTDIGWSTPGHQPEWPPLRELGRNLYAFREEVIREGNRDYAFDLLRLDYWLARTGIERRCGELFTAGLDGYRRNYQIANQIGGREFRELFRDRASLSTQGLTHGVPPEQAAPFIGEIIENQAHMLYDAMKAGQTEDYEYLHRGFEEWLKFLRFSWNVESWPPTVEAKLFEEIHQGYRIVLMTLAGRAISLAQGGRIKDADPYMEIARKVHQRPRQLASDIAPTLDKPNRFSAPNWSTWETNDDDPYPYGMRSISPEQSPLTFFSIRLLELSDKITEPLDLNGSAKRALEWFEANSERLANYLPDDPSMTREQRREAATDALKAAVRLDETEADREVIECDLSEEKISSFKADVYAGAFAENPIERIFQQAGAFLYLASDDNARPEERTVANPTHKGFLADLPANARTHWGGFGTQEWGRWIPADVIRQLCEEADDAPSESVSLDSPQALLEAIDRTTEELGPTGGLLVVLAGDWGGIQTALNANEPEGYVPAWRTPEGDHSGEIGRYHAHALLRGPRDGDRRVYIVDPQKWGCFIRVQCEGDQELRIDISTISAERARELLDQNPSHFPSEPDEESKLRKLQTHVEIVVGARHGFQVRDPSRARRIVHLGQVTVSQETES